MVNVGGGQQKEQRKAKKKKKPKQIRLENESKEIFLKRERKGRKKT